MPFDNLVSRVLSYPPYGAREGSVGRVGENPGNEVGLSIDVGRVRGGKGQNTCNNTCTEVILRSPGYRENWNVKNKEEENTFIHLH